MLQYTWLAVTFFTVNAFAVDTLRFPIITNERFPAQPSEKQAAVQLPTGRSFARVLLYARLSCPCGRGLGEWDYTVRFFVSNPTGQRDSAGNPIRERFEVARFITPYAANRPSSWNWTWQWDITDYRFLFSDSTEIVVNYVGWTQSALFTVWLEAIEGTPPYEVFAFDQLIEGSFPYGNPNDPIDRYTTGKRFRVPAQAELVKLRIVTTGHGFGGTDNAAEFAEKTHTIAINDTERFRQHLWRDDCGWNPVYPQDGTWPLARAGWCPGDVVHPFERWITDMVQLGTETVLDYRMQPFINQQFDAHPSSYLITVHVLYASMPAVQRRASVLSILSPTDVPPMRRINPTCGFPEIVVRNDGRDTIQTLDISFALDDQPVQSYQWQAPRALGLGDTAHVRLPVMVGTIDTPAVRRLWVRLSQVNGQPNQEQQFSEATSTFSDVPTIPGDSIIIRFTTTLYAREQGLAWTVRRLEDGALIAERRDLDGGITDTAQLRLEDGCYQFRFDNPAGYGLAWWATQQELGSGSLTLTANGKRLFTVEGDCGNGSIYNFRVGPVPQADVPRDTIDFGATPVGVPVQRQLVIKLANTAPLQVRQLQVTSLPANIGFRLVSTTPPLPPEGLWIREHQQMTVTLEYKPPQEETRVRSAVLTITSNDYDEPTIRILLRGTTPNVASTELPNEPVSWSIAPNPADNQLRLVLSAPVHHCIVVSRDGRVLSAPYTLERDTEVVINTDELAAGIYAAIVATRAGKYLTIPFAICCR